MLGALKPVCRLNVVKTYNKFTKNLKYGIDKLAECGIMGVSAWSDGRKLGYQFEESPSFTEQGAC